MRRRLLRGHPLPTHSLAELLNRLDQVRCHVRRVKIVVEAVAALREDLAEQPAEKMIQWLLGFAGVIGKPQSDRIEAAAQYVTDALAHIGVDLLPRRELR